MKKLHALGAAVIGVTLSASAALAAVPHDQAQPEAADPTLASDHGSLVSTVARDVTIVGGEHDNHGGAVSAVSAIPKDPVEADSHEGTAQAEGTDAAAPTDTHGSVVSVVAKDPTKVGGKNDNHGGAVSEAAHQAHPPQQPNGHANDHAGGAH
jgi:hypothetical protein